MASSSVRAEAGPMVGASASSIVDKTAPAPTSVPVAVPVCVSVPEGSVVELVSELYFLWRGPLYQRSFIKW